LIDAAGQPESNNSSVHIPLTRWEEVNFQSEITKGVAELLTHLDEYTEYYHKMIWWNLDRDKLYMMLDGIKLSPEDERSVVLVVERDPLAIVGNSLVYRVAAGAFIGVDGHQDADSLNYHYRDTNTQSEPLRISLPTLGLYAQSIMDECEACEEHRGSTEWVLTNDEPELAELGPQLLASRRGQLPDAMPSTLPDSIINIQNAATPPAPSGFADTLTALTNPNAFRDMAGLAGTQANARAALESAAGLATKFGSEAASIYKEQLAAKQAKEKLAVIKKAHADGNIELAELKKQIKRVLEEMHSKSEEDSKESKDEEFAKNKKTLDEDEEKGRISKESYQDQNEALNHKKMGTTPKPRATRRNKRAIVMSFNAVNDQESIPLVGEIALTINLVGGGQVFEIAPAVISEGFGQTRAEIEVPPSSKGNISIRFHPVPNPYDFDSSQIPDRSIFSIGNTPISFSNNADILEFDVRPKTRKIEMFAKTRESLSTMVSASNKISKMGKFYIQGKADVFIIEAEGGYEYSKTKESGLIQSETELQEGEEGIRFELFYPTGGLIVSQRAS